jgi:hypothetical protein
MMSMASFLIFILSRFRPPSSGGSSSVLSAMRGVHPPSQIRSCMIFWIAISVQCGMPWTLARYWVCPPTIACDMSLLPYRVGCILSQQSRSFLMRSRMGSHGVRSLILLPIHPPNKCIVSLSLAILI